MINLEINIGDLCCLVVLLHLLKHYSIFLHICKANFFQTEETYTVHYSIGTENVLKI